VPQIRVILGNIRLSLLCVIRLHRRQQWPPLPSSGLRHSHHDCCADTVKQQAARADAIVVADGGYGAVNEALAKKRQGQHSPTKLPITVRYNPEVLAYFKANGTDWQTPMNDVFCDQVAQL
jgi:uncharacterized protein (DUF4415 family)